MIIVIAMDRVFTPGRGQRRRSRAPANRRADGRAPPEPHRGTVLQSRLVTQIAGNGGDMVPSDLHEAPRRSSARPRRSPTARSVINAAGAQMKSLEEGLLDFPARRGDEVVLLCWKLGEDEIRLLARQRRGLRASALSPLTSWRRGSSRDDSSAHRSAAGTLGRRGRGSSEGRAEEARPPSNRAHAPGRV